jgi:hypothetical protein
MAGRMAVQQEERNAGGHELRETDVQKDIRCTHICTYRRTERKTYRNTQTNRDKQTDSTEVQKGRQTYRQMYSHSVHIPIRYIQTDQQTDRTDKHSKTNRPTRQIDRQYGYAVQKDSGRNSKK